MDELGSEACFDDVKVHFEGYPSQHVSIISKYIKQVPGIG